MTRISWTVMVLVPWVGEVCGRVTVGRMDTDAGSVEGSIVEGRRLDDGDILFNSLLLDSFPPVGEPELPLAPPPPPPGKGRGVGLRGFFWLPKLIRLTIRWRTWSPCSVVWGDI